MSCLMGLSVVRKTEEREREKERQCAFSLCDVDKTIQKDRREKKGRKAISTTLSKGIKYCERDLNVGVMPLM